MPKKAQSYLLYILGSLLFLSIPVFSSPDFDYSFGLFGIAGFRKSFLSYLLLLMFFYLNYLYLLPQFYFGKKKWLYYIIVLACYACVVIVPLLLAPNFPNEIPETNPLYPLAGRMRPERMSFLHFLEGSSLFQFLLVFFISLLLKINGRLMYMRNEKLKTEISYLKAQINPHFLFNTLNSLYSLTLAKSDEAPQAILKLSGMMRYVVTESTRDFVPLNRELDYIKNYIELQQLRIDDSTKVIVSVTGNTQDKVISPMVLIPFIENAFKYGINPDGDSEITITIDTDDKYLYLTVKNYKYVTELPDHMKSEQGLENTTLRLAYLYPDTHKLHISDTDDTFELKLNIAVT